MKNNNTVIVSRHQATIDWLQSIGIKGDVVQHATPKDVLDKYVYGNLPLHFAHLARSVHVVEIPNLPEGKRGNDLTKEELIEYGVRLQAYTVEKVK